MGQAKSFSEFKKIFFPKYTPTPNLLKVLLAREKNKGYPQSTALAKDPN